MIYDAIIIGGGAAGFFTAINIAEKNPSWKIIILEKSSKTLSKVKVSGGGRCNVTNARNKPSELIEFYPRGHKKLYKAFERFSTDSMVEWLFNRGVKTKVEDDLRVFPHSNSSQTIIDLFNEKIRELGIELFLNQSIESIQPQSGDWELHSNDQIYQGRNVIIATGSSPSFWQLIDRDLKLDLSSPVPSLFTFNCEDPRINGFQGLSFPNVQVKVTRSKFEEWGPLLITHWGFSGPAILKLSARAARELNKLNYSFDILINFAGLTQIEFAQLIDTFVSDNPGKKLRNITIEGIPKRYWEATLEKIDSLDIILGEMGKKTKNRLIEQITQAQFHINGKSTFKDEFVTCGGISLNEINLSSFESKKYKGLYFAGEVLDIDALTGGFNFQACWTAGWHISEHLKQQK